MPTIQNTKRIIKRAIERDVAVFLWSKHGQGKSQLVKQVAEEMGYEFIDVRAALLEATDFTGLPYVYEKDGEKKVDFAPSQLIPTKPNTILFLDELNRANMAVVNAAFQIVLDKRVLNKPLPPNCGVIAAGNPATDDYLVTDLAQEKAFMSRFVHITVMPTITEWLEYGEKKKIVPEIRNYIKWKGSDALGNSMDTFDLGIGPNPRAWDLLSDIISDLKKEGFDEKIQGDISDIATGLVGASEASAFLAFVRENNNLKINIAGIEKNYKGALQKKVIFAKDTERIDVLNQACEVYLKDIFTVKKFLKDENLRNNTMEFFKDLPIELAIKTIRGIWDISDNNKKITYKGKKQDEKVAVFSQFVDNNEMYKIIEVFEGLEDKVD